MRLYDIGDIVASYKYVLVKNKGNKKRFIKVRRATYYECIDISDSRKCLTFTTQTGHQTTVRKLQ